MYLTEDTRLTLTLTEITNPETIHTRIERNTSVRCEETIFTTSSRLNNSKTKYLIQQIYIFPSEIPESELPDGSVLSFTKKIASVRSERDSQPADYTPTSHSFVGSELFGFEPVSQANRYVILPSKAVFSLSVQFCLSLVCLSCLSLLSHAITSRPLGKFIFFPENVFR